MRIANIAVAALALAIPAASSALTYDIQGDTLLVNGEVFSGDLDKFERVIERNSNVKTLVLMDVPGSADYETNLEIIALIRQLGLNTHLTAKSHVASGGTDLFLGGVQRSMERGAHIGVHSWSDGYNDGSDFPKDSAEHRMFLDLYAEIGIPAAFYWFTLRAAPADGMHYMSEGEIKQYGLLTGEIR